MKFLKKYLNYIALLFIIFIVVGDFVYSSNTGSITDSTIPISQVLREAALKPSPIQEIQLSNDSNFVLVKYTNNTEKFARRELETSSAFITELAMVGYDFSSGPTIRVSESSVSSGILNILGTFLPVLLISGIIFFMLRRSQGNINQAMGFGKSKARRFAPTKTMVSFQNVAGVEESKQELAEIVEFLKSPDKFLALGAHIPRGVLLVGPPGTGKTMLAKAVAGEAGVPFFTISGSEFVEMFVGVGASRVRDLFEQAKKNAPCIIFVDEIDAVGRRRGGGMGGGNDEREQTLNQMLVEMDGFDSQTNIIIIAATNRPDVLDPALLRPGRFDRQVILDLPDRWGRLAILEVHAKGKRLEKEVRLETIAYQTTGFSGAELANLLNEAAILAARRNLKAISSNELDEAVLRVIAGPERHSRLISDKEKLLIAYHETGHAIIARMLGSRNRVHKLTIVARGRVGGLTVILPGTDEDRSPSTKGYFEERLAYELGGRVAEELIFEELSNGASDDIEQATDLARKMVTRYGMSLKLGPVSYQEAEHLTFVGGGLDANPGYSNELAYEIDCEVREFVMKAYLLAYKILSEQRAKLIEIAELVLLKETLEGVEFEQMFEEPNPEPTGFPAVTFD